MFYFSFTIFRIRTHAIKFMEMLVLVQSLKTQVGVLFQWQGNPFFHYSS